jgi:4-hydroxy-3-methylbut-2-enyl diphosphate reductase
MPVISFVEVCGCRYHGVVPGDDNKPAQESARQRGRVGPSPFRSATVDRVRASLNVWELPGGQIVLPAVFGFCQGVNRALVMLDEAVAAKGRQAGRLFLLGQIIHNPWVNHYFEHAGARILTPDQLAELARHIGPEDCAVIPAFGVPLPVERRLRAIGCRIIDTTCSDVRRLWSWAERASRRGFGVLIFGRAGHDETVVTRSRLEELGGRYLIVGDLDEGGRFCRIIEGTQGGGELGDLLGARATNATSFEPFTRLAQVSQTTMLYDETMKLRAMLEESFARRFGRDGLAERLLLYPTVCRATQDRQTAAVEMCRGGCDLVIVVGGFGSSNTRHLYELARSFCPTHFIEDAQAIRSEGELLTMDFARGAPAVVRDWLPSHRPVRIGILAGASSPEIVIGGVVERLAEFLS